MIIIKINGEQYRAIKSTQLLTRCKAIFGVALQATYIVDNYRLDSSWNSKEESTEYLKRANITLASSSIPNIIQFDTYELILQFKGGNCVLFNASEWASFTKVDVE